MRNTDGEHPKRQSEQQADVVMRIRDDSMDGDDGENERREKEIGNSPFFILVDEKPHYIESEDSQGHVTRRVKQNIISPYPHGNVFEEQ